jgi:putative transposase
MSKRRTHSPEFKARVAMEAISGRKTIQEIAADHPIHPILSSDIRFWWLGFQCRLTTAKGMQAVKQAALKDTVLGYHS